MNNPGPTVVKLYESETVLKWKHHYMISKKHCIYIFWIVEKILKDALQWSIFDFFNLLLFFDIIWNYMAKSLRIFSRFVMLGPEYASY